MTTLDVRSGTVETVKRLRVALETRLGLAPRRARAAAVVRLSATTRRGRSR